MAPRSATYLISQTPSAMLLLLGCHCAGVSPADYALSSSGKLVGWWSHFCLLPGRPASSPRTPNMDSDLLLQAWATTGGHDIDRPFSVRDGFLHLLANSWHKSIVLWWLNLFLCPPYRKKWRKKAEMLGLLQIFPIITHCAQCPTCAFPNAGIQSTCLFRHNMEFEDPSPRFTLILSQGEPITGLVMWPSHTMDSPTMAWPFHKSFVMNHSLQIHLASTM